MFALFTSYHKSQVLASEKYQPLMPNKTLATLIKSCTQDKSTQSKSFPNNTNCTTRIVISLIALTPACSEVVF